MQVVILLLPTLTLTLCLVLYVSLCRWLSWCWPWLQGRSFPQVRDVHH
jgi:hypothetical protein